MNKILVSMICVSFLAYGMDNEQPSLEDLNYLNSLDHSIINDVQARLNELKERRSQYNDGTLGILGPDEELIYAAIVGDLQSAKLALNKGADINARDEVINGTPLHLAIIEAHVNIISFLLSYSADVNVKDCFGRTPLDIALKNVNFIITHGLLAVSTIKLNKNNLQDAENNINFYEAQKNICLNNSREYPKELDNYKSKLYEITVSTEACIPTPEDDDLCRELCAQIENYKQKTEEIPEKIKKIDLEQIRWQRIASRINRALS